MNSKRKLVRNHTGSTFESFLEEEKILEEVETAAVKRVIAWQLENAMKEQRLSKRAMAHRLHTSRSQVERLLDPGNSAVSLQTVARATTALGKSLKMELCDSAATTAKRPQSSSTHAIRRRPAKNRR